MNDIKISIINAERIAMWNIYGIYKELANAL
jgi:hypothetical protein